MTYAPTDGGQVVKVETLPTEFSVRLKNLMMGTEYTITVQGFNSVGNGSPRVVTEATDIDCEFTRGGGEEERGGS